MSEPEIEGAEPLIVVARAVKTRGLKGEIVADLLTDFPERFADVSQLIAVGPDAKRIAVELEQHWFQKNRVILKLKDFNSIEASSALIGYDFAVPEADRVQLDEGSFYDWELEGCIVNTVAGKQVGTVTGVLATGGVPLLEIKDAEREYLVPLAGAIVTEVDIETKRIVIDPPEGLLEL
jgi:16S rRNA processing protein RimM